MAGYSVTFTVVDQATKQLDQINRRMAAMRAPVERMQRSMSRFIDLSGLRKVADGFSWITRMAGMALRTLTAIVPVLGAITSATTIAGMTKLVSSFAQWGNALQTNADQIGISTDTLQKWQDATTRAGGSAQDMTETLKNLHNVVAEAVTGRNAEALAMFKKFGIDVRDANGNLKTSTELLPEVFKVLDTLKDPADRARVASTLLGDSQNKLYEEFKQSGKSLQDWLALEDKHQRATEDQLKSLNDYRLAISGLETTFSQLGRQVSATLAQDLAPLIKQLDEWVQAHQPQILQAVHEVSTAFEGWLKDVDWQQVQDDINGIIQLLKIMLEVAEAVGKAVEKTMFAFGLTNRKFTKEDVFQNTPWYSNLTDDQKKQVRAQLGISDEQAQAAQHPKYNVQPYSIMNPGSWMNRAPAGVDPYTGKPFGTQGAFPPGGPTAAPAQRTGPPAPLGAAANKSAFYDEQRKLIYDAAVRAGTAHPEVVAELGATQSTLESGGGAHTPGGFNVYGIKSGGGVGGAGAPVSTQEAGAGGMYATQASFATFKSKEDAADAYVAFLQKHQRYQGVLNAADVQSAINAQAASGYATDPNYRGKLQSTFGRYGGQAAPVQMAAAAPPAAPPPTAPINGAVNVDITHRNAPPDATVTARGSGSVNVAPPRIEHPQLDFATA